MNLSWGWSLLLFFVMLIDRQPAPRSGPGGPVMRLGICLFGIVMLIDRQPAPRSGPGGPFVRLVVSLLVVVFVFLSIVLIEQWSCSPTRIVGGSGVEQVVMMRIIMGGKATAQSHTDDSEQESDHFHLINDCPTFVWGFYSTGCHFKPMLLMKPYALIRFAGNFKFDKIVWHMSSSQPTSQII